MSRRHRRHCEPATVGQQEIGHIPGIDWHYLLVVTAVLVKASQNNITVSEKLK
jgi:hypothetical protein